MRGAAGRVRTKSANCARTLCIPRVHLSSCCGLFLCPGLSVAAAALAVAVEHERDAALQAVLLDRERAAMQAEDLRSYVAERHFTSSWLSRAFWRPMTWAAAYAQRHEDLELAHDAMRAALRDVRQGNFEEVEERLAAEVGDSDDEDDQ